jgi:flagellar biosynthesis protein FlhG
MVSHAHGIRGARPTCLLVASGKGGVGTSVIAALTALAASERGEQVLLVDASESSGSLHQLFGARPTHSLWMLMDARCRVDDALIEVGENLTLMPGGMSGTAQPPASDHQRRAALARLAQIYSRYQLVVFDGGSRLDTITAISELTDPSLLLVTSADRLALAANYALVKCVSARRPNAIVSVVSNRHGEALAKEACEYLVTGCTHFLGRTIDVAGAVPDDACLHAAVGAGMSVYDALDGSPAAEAVRGIVTRFIPTWPSAPQSSSPVALLSTPLPSSSRRWS